LFATLGAFTTPVYELPVTIGNKKGKLEFGVLPEELWQTLFQAEVDGILGTQIFRHFSCLLSMRREVICFSTLERAI